MKRADRVIQIQHARDIPAKSTILLYESIKRGRINSLFVEKPSTIPLFVYDILFPKLVLHLSNKYMEQDRTGIRERVAVCFATVIR